MERSASVTRSVVLGEESFMAVDTKPPKRSIRPEEDAHVPGLPRG